MLVKESENIPIRNYYSPGYSYVKLSYYKSFLVFTFVPFEYTKKNGKDIYSKKVFLSTSLDVEGAESLQKLALPIIKDGNEGNQMDVTLSCKNNASLTFMYKPDEENIMSVYLVIDKNNETIPFKFKARIEQVKVGDNWVTRIVHITLIEFVQILEEYIAGETKPMYY